MSDRNASRWGAALASLLTLGRRRRGRRGATEPVAQRSLRTGHQPEDDLSVAVVVLFSIVVLGLVGGALLAMTGLFRLLADPEAVPPAAASTSEVRRVPPPPRLQADPAVDLRGLHRRERELLTTYGWTDRAAGRVRIPIDRAIALTAARGLPVMDTGADSVRRVLSESGFLLQRRGPPPATAPPYLGLGPEPFTPAPGIERELRRPGDQLLDGPRRVGDD